MKLTVALLAAIIGTALMTLSSETEAAATGRSPSQAPGKALSRVKTLLGGRPLEGKPLKIAATDAFHHIVYAAGVTAAAWLIVTGVETAPPPGLAPPPLATEASPALPARYPSPRRGGRGCSGRSRFTPPCSLGCSLCAGPPLL